jgi:hypothetical protein
VSGVFEAFEGELGQELDVLLFEVESVEGQRLDDGLRPFGEAASDAAVALLLLVEIAKPQVVSVLPPLGLQDAPRQLLVLPLDLLLPEGAAAVVGSVRGLAGRAGYALPRGGALQGLCLPLRGHRLYFLAYGALDSDDALQDLVIFSFQLFEFELADVFGVGVLFSR